MWLSGHIFGDLVWLIPFGTWSVSIAALTSQRTNLSPFTKGCREWGVSMRVSDFFSDPLGPPTLLIHYSLSLERVNDDDDFASVSLAMEIVCKKLNRDCDVLSHLWFCISGAWENSTNSSCPCGRGNSVVNDALRRRANLLVENYSNSCQCGA